MEVFQRDGNQGVADTSKSISQMHRDRCEQSGCLLWHIGEFPVELEYVQHSHSHHFCFLTLFIHVAIGHHEFSESLSLDYVVLLAQKIK